MTAPARERNGSLIEAFLQAEAVRERAEEENEWRLAEARDLYEARRESLAAEREVERDRLLRELGVRVEE